MLLETTLIQMGYTPGRSPTRELTAKIENQVRVAQSCETATILLRRKTPPGHAAHQPPFSMTLLKMHTALRQQGSLDGGYLVIAQAEDGPLIGCRSTLVSWGFDMEVLLDQRVPSLLGNGSDLVSMTATSLKNYSAKAWKAVIGGETLFIPKSVAKVEGGVITAPAWLWEKKGVLG